MQKIALKLVHLKRLLGKATNAILNYNGVQERGTKVNPPSHNFFIRFRGCIFSVSWTFLCTHTWTESVFFRSFTNAQGKVEGALGLPV